MKSDISRSNVQYNEYIHIAFNSFLDYDKLEEQLQYKQLDFEKYIIERKQYREYLKCIVFSAMTIEAYLYDIVAIELGDSFTNNTLDKLSSIEKYSLLLKIKNDEEIDKNSTLYCLLRELIRTRNYLVHAKTEDLFFTTGEFDIEKYKKRIEKEKRKYISIENAIKSLFYLHKQIHSLNNLDHLLPPILLYGTSYTGAGEVHDLEELVLRKINLTIAST